MQLEGWACELPACLRRGQEEGKEEESLSSRGKAQQAAAGETNPQAFLNVNFI